MCGSHLRSQMIRFFISDFGCCVVRVSLLERPKICPTKNGDRICLSENGDNSVTGAGGGVWSHNCGATVPTVSWRETLKGGGAAAQIYL